MRTPVEKAFALFIALFGLWIAHSRRNPLSPKASMSTTTTNTPTTTAAIIVYVTVPSKDLGTKIGHTLVSEKLAACVNIVPGLTSIYQWQGEINEDSELLLMIKTRAVLLEKLTIRVKELHSYDECEVVAMPIVGGSESYLKWVMDSTLAE